MVHAGGVTKRPRSDDQATSAPPTLGRAFFERPPDEVARDLVGSIMLVNHGSERRRALIVETEAYGGADDAASHAHRGPTRRCDVMFGPAGHLYVYRSYGVHWGMNVVTQDEGVASAVLLRGAELLDGTRDGEEGARSATTLRGPGNLTRGLAVTGEDNGVDCCAGPDGRVAFVVGADAVTSPRVARSTRIGITREVARESRYFLEGHGAVSRFAGVPRAARASGH